MFKRVKLASLDSGGKDQMSVMGEAFRYRWETLENSWLRSLRTKTISPFSLVPRLRLGTHIFRALPGNYLAFWPIMEAEPPGHAFPGGAWEREVWHDSFSILSFETASLYRSVIFRVTRV